MSVAEKIVNFLIKKPFVAVSLTSLILILSISGLRYAESDFSGRYWFQKDDPVLVELERLEKLFSDDNNVVVLLRSKSELNNLQGMKLIERTSDALEVALEVKRVKSLSRYFYVESTEDELILNEFRDQMDEATSVADMLQGAPEVYGKFISKDQKTAILVAELNRPLGGRKLNYDKIHDSIELNLDKLNLQNEGVRYYLSGIGSLVYFFKQSAIGDLSLTIPLLTFFCFLLLYFFFRDVKACLLPFFILTVASAGSFGLSGFLGFKFHNLSSVVAGVLVTIAFADTMHILCTLRNLQRGGDDYLSALRKSLIKNFMPTLLTSITTAIGFFSFYTAKLEPLRQIGVTSGLGTLLLWLTTYGILAPLLFKFRLNISTRTFPLFERMIAVFNRKVVLTLSCGLFILFSVGLPKLEVNTNPIDYFPKSHPMAQAQKVYDETMKGAPGTELIVESGNKDGVWDPEFIKKLTRFERDVLALPRVSSLDSPLTLIRKISSSLGIKKPLGELEQKQLAELFFIAELNSPETLKLSDYLDVNKENMRMSVFWDSQDSRTSLKIIEDIERVGDEHKIKVKSTGKFTLFYRMTDYVFSAFAGSMALSLSMIFLIFWMLTKSLKMASLCMIPNMLSIIIGLGTLGYLGIPIDTTVCTAAAVCLGLSVDDTIHMVYKYTDRPSGQGLESLLSEVAPSLIQTSLCLIIGFGSFAFSSFVPNRGFGILSAYIIFWAVLFDIYLLPHLLKIATSGDNNESKHHCSNPSLAT